MTTEIAMQQGIPGVLRPDGYDPPPDLSFDRWCSLVETFQLIERASRWWIGDLLVFGEQKFHEDASQAFPDAFSGTPYAESTLRASQWVSERVPRGTRVEGLSWSHHRAVAELPAPERDHLLKVALTERLSTRDLITRSKARKEQLRGRVEGDALDEPDHIWRPSLDDLTAEARAALESHAPGGRHRLGYVQGWISSLIWSECRDAFIQWGGPE